MPRDARHPFREARAGIEPANRSFADSCLTTWLPRRRASKLFQHQHFLKNMAATTPDLPHMSDADSGRRNPHGPIDTRGRARLFWDIVFALVRGIFALARNVYATFGILLLAGAAVAIGGTYAFAEFAGHVQSGKTQQFDDAVLRWIGAHRPEVLEPLMLEITFLGTGSVVIVLVLVSGLFLWLSNHKYSTILLLIATTGGILLNNLLKAGFGRPRPQVFDWGTHAVTWSFPSGHAMSAAIVYGTVAYLAARLQKRRWHRAVTMLAALIIILLIAVSRLYLGVHYPSDVLAGIIIGLAWAGFCVAMLEAFQLYARRRAPKVRKHEEPAPTEEPATTG
jgi:undecaprenyl-diphosphatase